MHRILWLIFALVAVASLGYWYQAQQPNAEGQVERVGIRLTNRPASFCPIAAQVVIVQSATSQIIEFDEFVSIENCDEVIIPSSNLAAAVEYQIFVLVPNARALRTVGAGPIATLIEAPIQIGDVNEDNIINEVDQKFVEERIGQTSLDALAADVDGDAVVTILDYSLVTTNQGAGYARPDQKPWGDN